jgi:hypothetical protein
MPIRNVKMMTCSTFDTYNYEFIETIINIGVGELISYPSINACGFSGSGSNGWDGELELDN